MLNSIEAKPGEATRESVFDRYFRIHRAKSSLRSQTRLDTLISEDRAAVCLPAALEILYQAKKLKEFDSQREAIEFLQWLPTTSTIERVAIDTMHQLARRGMHRTPVPDLVIAATAHVHGATLLHYDSDFERIAEVTGQPHEWIVPRGQGHPPIGED